MRWRSNVQHMAREHSFFLPDLEYLVDLPGMMQYLGEKVSVGNICLHCNGRGRAFHSLEAVQKHMLDKGHCKLWYEGDAELEYSDFYDFRASYPDNDGTEELRAEDEKSGYAGVIQHGTGNCAEHPRVRVRVSARAHNRRRQSQTSTQNVNTKRQRSLRGLGANAAGCGLFSERCWPKTRPN